MKIPYNFPAAPVVCYDSYHGDLYSLLLLQERRALSDLSLLQETPGGSAQSDDPRQPDAGGAGDRCRAAEGVGVDDKVSVVLCEVTV